jgi:hypothetical protein
MMAKLSPEKQTASRGKDELSLDRVQKFLKFWLPDGDNSHDLPKRLGEMTANLGQPARKAIYAILCDKDNPLRQTLQTTLATEGLAAAVVILAPVLAGFVPAGAVIILATLIVKSLSTAAGGAFCEELARLDPDHAQHTPRKAPSAPKAKPAQAKTGAAEKPRSPAASTPAAKEKTPKRPPSPAAEKTTTPPAAKPKPAPKAKNSPPVVKSEPASSQKVNAPARPKKTPSSAPPTPLTRKPRPKTT